MTETRTPPPAGEDPARSATGTGYAQAAPAPAVAAVPSDETVDDEHTAPADLTLADMQQLRWGPIVAGTLTAAGIFILASLLAIAVGIQAAPGVEAFDDMDILGVLVTSLIALGAFFVGGFVSSWTAAISEQGRALVNGFLVWALWVVGVAILAVLGVGTLAGAMGELFGQVGAPATDLEASELIDGVREASWASFLAFALTALAAMLGAVIGAREDLRGAWMRYGAGRLRV